MSSFLTFKSVLGRGTFGSVFECAMDDGEPFAVKVMPFRHGAGFEDSLVPIMREIYAADLRSNVFLLRGPKVEDALRPSRELKENANMENSENAIALKMELHWISLDDVMKNTPVPLSAQRKIAANLILEIKM